MQVKTFIDRPILAGVLSVALVLLGVIGLVQLPVEQFPNIAPPTIRVSASYTGANAETVMKSVVVPLEEAINGVENMMYMTSSASNSGSASINVFFRQGTDPDIAAVNVQNRIATAQGLLPAEVTRSGVNVRRRQTSTLKSLGLFSPNGTYDNKFLNNYFKINLEPRLSRVAGVGEVDVQGADYSIRIWLRPDKMAEHGLVPSDITTVLAQQNIESSAGTFGQEANSTFEYVLKYRGRYEKPEEFEALVVRSLPDGQVLRIGDVAEVELGSRSYNIESEINGKPGAMCMISQTPGSNANEIITEIDALVEQIRKDLPPDMELIDLMSTKDFLDESISDVTRTLLEAMILVIFVVYLFLQSFRSTLIPAVAIVVSLVGTFAFIHLLGFSLNTITLFALVLVIGTVVDDAIVVVEAVQARFDGGERSPYQATLAAMGGITSALITTSLVFMSVFIPVSFLGGTTGVFYKQFGLTMSIAVLISTFNALTLSPALCALFMKPHADEAVGGRLTFSSRFHRSFDAAFATMAEKYTALLRRFFRHKWIAGLLLLLVLGGFAYLVRTTRTGLVPEEDMGTIMVSLQGAPGSGKAESRRIAAKVEERIKDLPEMKAYSKVVGVARGAGQGASNSMFVIRLKPWAERRGKEHSQASVISEIYRRTADIAEAKIIVNAQPVIQGYGANNGFELYIQDREAGGSMDDLNRYTRQLIDTLARREEIQRATTAFDTRFPQYRMDIDAARCQRVGVSPAEVLNVVSTYVGGAYVSNVNVFSKLYRVMLQARPEDRLTPEALNNMYVRTSSGAMAPVAQFVTLKKVYGSENLTRFNMFPAIQVNGAPEKGYSTGQAIKAVREVADAVLPAGYAYEFGGMSREESSIGHSTLWVYLAAIVFVFLVLCALYESLLIPLAVLLSVPFGLFGSFLFALLFGIENNIYMQTGVIMLIGLLSKTAILLTEYASARRREGMSVKEAALDAARVRLRPILMTSLTMIFGLLPMIFATGAGANGNISLGVGTVGGMLIGTLALLVITPVLFIVFRTLEERLSPTKRKA